MSHGGTRSTFGVRVGIAAYRFTGDFVGETLRLHPLADGFPVERLKSMALSRLAQEFADEIKQHDWSDAPYRRDRAGHDRVSDTHSTSSVLTENGPNIVLWNVVVVTAQVLMYSDPNLDLVEFAIACGLPSGMTGTSEKPDGFLKEGIRRNTSGQVTRPGTYE